MFFHPMDKENNLVTAANSILKRFNIETYHPSLPALDDALKRHVRIVFLLFDALGSSIIKKHAPNNSKLKKSPMIKLTSVIPATTVAATTAFLRGKYPVETGWLGWTQYFKDLDQRINVFPNVDADSETIIPGPNIMESRYPGESVFDKVAATNPSVRVRTIWPSFKEGGAEKEKDFFKQLESHLEIPGPLLMYGYWTEPDSTMHMNGVNSFFTRRSVRKITKQIDELSDKHSDTLFVILADHGMVDVKYFDISEHEDFYSTLIRPFSVEGRNAMFDVKEEAKTQFEQLFKKYYGDHFILLTKEEVIKYQVFGFAEVNENSEVFFGDYLAIATSEYSFFYSPKGEKPLMKAHHAGITDDEMQLQLTLINN